METSAPERQRLLSVAVVGAGYSGVEVAGEIDDLLRSSSRFYRNIKASDIQVTLVEGRDRILPELPDKLSTFDEALGDNALEAFISRLRRKLHGSGATIRTLRGLGYLVEAAADEAG